MKRIHGFDWLVVLAFATLSIAPATYFVWSERVEREAREAKRSALIAAEPWRESPEWCGMTVGSKVSAPRPVWTVFENDPPAPKQRKKVLNRAWRRFDERSLIAWSASIDSVSPHPDGWETVVTVHPTFKGTAFTTSTSIETWQISKDGNARCIKCEPVVGLYIVD